MSEYRILISNDDGYNSPGIMALYAALQATLGSGVHLDVVAPEQDRSGASNSLTLDRPLSVRKSAQGFWYVNGTPTDCVHIAVTGFLPHRPNLVVSGINNGANMGDDTIYSGTVAAAMEGFQCGLPAIAFSLASKDFIHLDDAAKVAASFVQQFIRNPSPLGQCLLNVNIPPLPLESLGHFACTRLGKRHHAEPMIPSHNPKGETVYWIGPPGSAKDAGPGTDFHAVANGKVSVSPLKADLTDGALMDALQGWL